MKLLKTFCAMALALSVASMATAQTRQHPHRQGHSLSSASTTALSALQKDLETAIQSMTSALPIYDGDRVKSIHSAHRVLVMADHALAGKNASVRQQPTATDHVASKKAHEKYTAAQIQASQQAMQAGLAALDQAAKDLKAAEGSTPNKAGIEAGKHLQHAINEATKAISIHANQSASTPGARP